MRYRDSLVPPRCSQARFQARCASPAVSLPAPIAWDITRCPRGAPPPPPCCFQPPGSHQPPVLCHGSALEPRAVTCTGSCTQTPDLPFPLWAGTLPHVQQHVAAGAAVQCRWGGLGCCAGADGHRAQERLAVKSAVHICLSGSALIEIVPGCCWWAAAQQPCFPFSGKTTESWWCSISCLFTLLSFNMASLEINRNAYTPLAV